MPTDPTPTPWPSPPDTGRTHYDGCWRERGHHNCAVARVERVEAERDALRKAVVEMAIPYEALRMDDGSRKWIAPSVWNMIIEATETARRSVNNTTPARPTDTPPAGVADYERMLRATRPTDPTRGRGPGPAPRRGGA